MRSLSFFTTRILCLRLTDPVLCDVELLEGPTSFPISCYRSNADSPHRCSPASFSVAPSSGRHCCVCSRGCCHNSDALCFLYTRLYVVRVRYKGSSLPLFPSIIIPPPKLPKQDTKKSSILFLKSSQATMQFKVLAVLSFMALTGSAQRCLKGNGHNRGESCEGVGNLVCSHNLKHVVSTSSKPIALRKLLANCIYHSLSATTTMSGRGLPTVSSLLVS